MRRIATAATAIVVALAALLGFAAPALAHNSLTSSDPSKESAIEVAPDKVTLTFDQDVQAGGSDRVINQLVVNGPGGTQWAKGPVEVDGNVVTVALEPLGPKGEYKIGYRVLSADGHPVAGEVPFTLTKAGTGEPVGTSTPDGEQQAGEDATSESGGLPLWVWIAGAGGLLIIGVVLALRLGKDQ